MITSGPCTDVGRSLPLNLCCVCASQSRHEWEQMLPLRVLGHVVQLHRETADRAREALRHVLDPANRPVLKASGDQGRFIDASAAVLSRELMRARFELPIQDVIKVVHGGRPCGAPPRRKGDPAASRLSIAPGACRCAIKALMRLSFNHSFTVSQEGYAVTGGPMRILLI